MTMYSLGRRALFGLAAGAFVAGGLSLGAAASDVEKVHFLIPGGAGGGWDGAARGTGEALTKAGLLGQASFENMSGGGGGKAIAHIIEIAERAGDTLMVNSTPIVMRSLTGVFPQSFRDLTPIAATQGDFAAMVVRNDSPYQSFSEVAEAFTADPKSVKVAGGSVRGGMDHVVAALAFQAAGGDPNSVVYVNYDAGGKALASILSGETDILSTGLSEALEQQRQGQVRILGFTGGERIADAPDLPTLKEQGYDVEFVNWRGFFGAPGLDPAAADAYAAMFGKMYDTPEYEEVRSRMGWTNIYKPRAEFVTFLEEQEEVVKAMFTQLGVETVR